MYLLMRDMSRPLNEVLSWTYRQHEFFWERYLHQVAWDIQLSIDLNPWCASGEDSHAELIDAASAEGLAKLQDRGIEVKTRRVKSNA